MTKKQREMNLAENPLYHDTWKLLKKYRDVVWSLELSVQQVRNRFEIEYGSSIEDFLESVYLAGADIAGGDIEHHAKCIERSHRMIKLLDSSVELLRNKHKNGETYYWLLYYTFLSPQQMKNVEEIVEQLRPHIRDHQLPHLLPQETGGDRGIKLHSVGVYLQGEHGDPGKICAGNGVWHINGTERHEIGTGLLFYRKYRCVKLCMLKIVPKTNRAGSGTFHRVLFFCPEKGHVS